MRALWLYGFLNRIPFLGYRAKIMLTAFLGVHVPLLAVFALLLALFVPDFETLLVTEMVAAGAALVGTAVTMLVVNELLGPIRTSTRNLRAYVTGQVMPNPQGAGKHDRAATTEHALTTMRQLNDTIDVLASIDAETALLTRKCVIKAIDQLLPLEERPAALLHISIENLGRVRNSVGDAVSHEMLRRMVSVTFNNLPGNTIKGRLGDHAIGAVVRLGPHDSIENTARKLRRALIRTQQYGDNDIVADIRIGIALWPQDGSSGDDLVRQAATAAVHHDVGADNITFFNRTASETLARNFELESGLRAAIKGEQMVLHYQPVVDHRAQRAVGAEALVRWNHPTLGVVGPDQFIPIAEQSGLIVELGHWVLREACMQLRSWQDQNVSISHMSVNLSARQFLDPMLEETVTDVLSETGIDPNALQLEITESVAMANIEQTLAVAHRLREMGITMAIDDFGTGHCSMSYLRSLPVDVLKIDRTFVADVDWDLGKGAICEAIITLARGLRLSVVAEGVETRAELDWLAGQGCEVFQGYFFNKPLDAEAFVSAGLGTPRLSSVAAE